MSYATENDAGTRWCPFVRNFAAPDNGSEFGPFNRIGKHSAEEGVTDAPWNKCIGSRCMAWRWRGPEAATHGYCGLAGRPGGAS